MSLGKSLSAHTPPADNFYEDDLEEELEDKNIEEDEDFGLYDEFSEE